MCLNSDGRQAPKRRGHLKPGSPDAVGRAIFRGHGGEDLGLCVKDFRRGVAWLAGWLVCVVCGCWSDGWRPDFATAVIRTASVLKESCGITFKVDGLCFDTGSIVDF